MLVMQVFQEAEFQARKDFVAKSPLFAGWQPRFRRLLEMSLIKEVYSPGSLIITQGESTNGLTIIQRYVMCGMVIARERIYFNMP